MTGIVEKSLPVAADYAVDKGFTLWLFGPPGAGKTTVSGALKETLEARGVPVVLFDGDITRKIVGEGVGRSIDDRKLLTRRYCTLTSYFADSRIIVILAAINHTNKQRAYARRNHPDGQFGLVWINTPIDVCMERDPKGLYAYARKEITEGKSPQVVGLDIPFEEPVDTDVVIKTESTTPEKAGLEILDFLVAAGSLRRLGG